MTSTTTQLIVGASIALDLILIVAYIELHAVMHWYKKQFNAGARAYRYVEKISWQRKLVNTLLLRRPVAIKQPFKLIKLNDGKHCVRTET